MATRTMRYLSIYLYFCAFFMTISLSYRDDTRFYRKMSIDNINLCSVLTERKIQLNESHNALLVTHSLLKRSNFRCNFKVSAHETDGLFALVRRINFRKDLHTGKCIDYVRFHASDNRKREFCGNLELNAFDINLRGTSPLDVLNLGMEVRSGKIRTTIFISQEPVPPGMHLDLEIVFTGYNECNNEYSTQCILGNSNFCINKAYLADLQVNCPFRDCGDEANCNVHKFIVDLPEEDQQPVSSTKVVLSAIGSLAVSFLIFIVVLWFCKKAHLICFNEECMNNSSTPARADTRQAQPSRVIEMENRPEPNARVVATPEEDKDLPPSYESLFANR